jgi:hypothetical protein
MIIFPFLLLLLGQLLCLSCFRTLFLLDIFNLCVDLSRNLIQLIILVKGLRGWIIKPKCSRLISTTNKPICKTSSIIMLFKVIGAAVGNSPIDHGRA